MNKIQLRLDPGKIVYRVTAEDTEIVIVYTWSDDSDIFYGTKISQTGATQIAGFKKENYKEFTGEILFTCRSKYKKEEKEVLSADSFKDMAIECDNDRQMTEIVEMAESVGLKVEQITPMYISRGFRYFSCSENNTYSNYDLVFSDETVIHYTDFIDKYK